MDTEEKDKREVPAEIDGTPAVARFVRVAAGALAVLVLLVGGFIFFRLHSDSHEEIPQQALEDRIGIVDMQKVLKKHKEYAHLQRLEQEVKTLEAAISVEHMTMEFTPPEPDKKAFEEAAQQEKKLDMIMEFSKRLDALNQKEAELRKELEPRFSEEIKAVEKTYLNEILNIRLKLDNAREMRLTEEEVNLMLSRLEELQKARGDEVMKKKASQEEYVQSIIGAERAALRSEVDKYNADKEAQTRAENLRRETEAQQRNAAAMEQASVVPMANSIRIAKQKAVLAAKKQEIRVLEKHILKDIAGLASKLAIMNKLTLIVSSTEVNIQGENYQEFGLGKWQPVRTPVIGINTIDLTEALMKELEDSPENQQESTDGKGKEENQE